MHHFKSFYGDPITALYVDDSVAVIGTALGMVSLYKIVEGSTTIIAKTSKEMISAVNVI
jgi:hypothetical protein